MPGIVKTGVALRKDTLAKLERYMEKIGIRNRSKIISEALEMYLADKASLFERGCVGGAILMYYDHEDKDVETRLTDIQHNHLNVIISNTHAHIDKRNCIEAILVRGEIDKIRELIYELETLRGLKALRYGFFKISEK